MREALPHQKQALHRLRGVANVALLWDMRLGKTLTIIRWASQWGGSILVVAPKGVLRTWAEELALEGFPSTSLFALDRAELPDDFEPDPGWYLTNYEGLSERGHRTSGGRSKAVPSAVAAAKWNTVIIDESVSIKNPQALRTKVCRRWLGRAAHRAILSGLPHPESSLDAFEQLAFVFGRWMGCESYWGFRQRWYVMADPFGQVWSPKRGTLQHFREELQSRCLRLTKQDAGLERRRVHEVRHVTLPTKVRKCYVELRKHFRIGETQTKWRLTQYNWLSRLASGVYDFPGVPSHRAKLDELAYVTQGDLVNERLVVWYRFLAEGRAIASLLRNQGRWVGNIHGSVSPEDRHAYVRRFGKRERAVLCCQEGCGRYGLDFSAGSVAIYFSLGPSHNTYGQTLERLIHPRKRGSVLYVYLLASDTVDEQAYQTLGVKRVQARGLLR